MADIEKDIEKSKKQESCNVELIDGKISCTFNLNLNISNNYEYSRWTNIKKVFDDWDEFNKYAKEFFTN